MSTGLLQQLRTATWPLHQQAERAGIMPTLLRGQLPQVGFVALQRQLHALYTTLEAALDTLAPASPGLAALLPSLRRSAWLADDLATLHGGPGWAGTHPLLPATQAYQARLQQLALQAPEQLLAHAYVRYLGDLAGGQMLGQRLRQSLGLSGTAGTRFFDFGTPAQVRALSDALRQLLADWPLSPAQTEALVAQAQWAFAQHVRLFEALAETGPDAGHDKHPRAWPLSPPGG